MNRFTPGRAAIFGALLLLFLAVVGGLAFIYSGAYNVAATVEHTGVTRWALNTLQERSVATRAGDLPPPPSATEDNLLHGFEHFNEMCVVCHGAPGQDRGEFGQGMTPTPPNLSEAADEWAAEELFWIVRNGIKVAGMPAFGPTHSDEEIWGIVRFVERLPEMTPQEYQGWVTQYAADSQGDSAGHPHAPGTPSHGH